MPDATVPIQREHRAEVVAARSRAGRRRATGRRTSARAAAGSTRAQTIETERRHPIPSAPRRPAITVLPCGPQLTTSPSSNGVGRASGRRESKDGCLHVPVGELGRETQPPVVDGARVDQLDRAPDARAGGRRLRLEVVPPEPGVTRSVRDGVDERAGERRRLGCVSGVRGAAASVGASCALSHAPTATARTMTATTVAMSDLERVVVGSAASSCAGRGRGLDGRGGAADGATLAVLAASRLRSSGWLLTAAPAPSDGGFAELVEGRGAVRDTSIASVSPCQSHRRQVRRSVMTGPPVVGRRGGLLGRGGGRRGGGCRWGGRGRRSARGGA